MPRGPRIFLDNVCYHIIARGNQKQNIFLEETDYERYLELLARYKIRYRFKLYGYCLMSNHVHLIVEPNRPKQITKVMQGLNQSYSIWFNKKYKKVGHLWQDRYKNFIIQKDRYLLTCINYVELNPIRSNVVRDPLEYPWGSYKFRTQDLKNSLLNIVNLD